MLAATGSGPHVPVRVLAGYLDAERRLGRLPESADPEALASMLMGACYHRAHLELFADLPVDRDDFADGVARMIVTR